MWEETEKLFKKILKSGIYYGIIQFLIKVMVK